MTGVFKRKPEPPWQFEIKKIPLELEDEDDDDDDGNGVDEDQALDGSSVAAADGGERAPRLPSSARGGGGGEKKLGRVYAHVLDWQAPRNYVFVPRWMMAALGLNAREVVELTWVRLREGAQVTLKPLTKDFSSWANPQAVMESELKYYSSLTVGSTIVIDYKDATHALEVLSVMAGDEKLDGANIQDVNVAVDFAGVAPHTKKKPKKKPTQKHAATTEAAPAAATGPALTAGE